MQDQNLLGKRKLDHIRDLPANSTLELPFWLAKFLHSRSLVSLSIPKWFTEEFKCIIEADPKISNLKDKSNHYYDFGIKLAEILPFNASLFKLVGVIFFNRMKALFDLVSHLKETDTHDLLLKLTDAENDFYHQARKSVRNFREQKDEKQGDLGYNTV